MPGTRAKGAPSAEENLGRAHAIDEPAIDEPAIDAPRRAWAVAMLSSSDFAKA